MAKVAALALVAGLAGFGFHALAQTRPDMRPDIRQSVTPIGTSSSNGISFVWLYEPTERAVYLCHSLQNSSDRVECKAKTLLP